MPLTMSNKPFIHPDILIHIRETLTHESEERLEQSTYSEAKQSGQKFAENILRELFPKTAEYGAVSSHFNTETLTSDKFQSYREQIISIHYQKKTFDTELNAMQRSQSELSQQLSKYETSWFRFFYKKRILLTADRLTEVNSKIDQLKAVIAESYVNLDFQFESTRLRDTFSDLCSSFATLKSASVIWDVVYQQLNLDTKAAASTSVTRNEVKIDFKGIDIIKTTERVLHVENFNGGDFYFYPNFIVYFKNNDEIALIDYTDLYVLYSDQLFLEERTVIPADTIVVGETWYRVNKDGSPDKRFVSNYKIPKVIYGSLHYKTTSGINEMYYVSDAKKAKHFSEQFVRYQTTFHSNH